MNTKSIILEQVAVAEFQRMEQYWGDRRKIHDDNVYSRMRNPISSATYEELLSIIMSLDCANRICVRTDSHTWLKKYTDKIRGNDLALIASLAKKDPLKRNYLEVRLRDITVSGFSSAIMEFGEKNGRITGY